VNLPDGRLDYMRKALSEYYSETSAEGDNLVASLSVDNLPGRTDDISK